MAFSLLWVERMRFLEYDVRFFGVFRPEWFHSASSHSGTSSAPHAGSAGAKNVAVFIVIAVISVAPVVGSATDEALASATGNAGWLVTKLTQRVEGAPVARESAPRDATHARRSITRCRWRCHFLLVSENPIFLIGAILRHTLRIEGPRRYALLR